MSFLLDTDTCSAHLKRPAGLTSRMVQHAGRLHVSILTVGELLTWARRRDAPPRRLEGIEDFLGEVETLLVGDKVAKAFAELRLVLRAILALSVLAVAPNLAWAMEPLVAQRPNIVFVFADQWRADAVGYAADPNVKTSHLDQLARRSVNFVNAVSGCPVCCPYRASLLTGRRPLSHGVFLNDVPLPEKEVSMAEILGAQGYATAYIGKWHLDGHGRSSYIPPERRQGFEYFKAT